MKQRIPQEKAELLAPFEEQLGFLEASANSYDRGFDSEAKRLAVTLRVLLHDTNLSKSLLGQLGLKSKPFLDTALAPHPGSIAGHVGLVALQLGAEGARYVPYLDEVPGPTRFISFDDWWNGTIYIVRDGASMSRKQLICTMANQDGGAHVDPHLDELYARISRRNELGWTQPTVDGDQPIAGNEKAAVRQVAHEVLKTLRPDYEKTFPSDGAHMTIAGFALEASPSMPEGAPAVPLGAQGPASLPPRNRPCPCGSGKLYKRWHGKGAA